MAERLEHIRRKRQQASARVPGSGVQPSHQANDNLAIGLLRLMQIYEMARRSRTVQRSRSSREPLEAFSAPVFTSRLSDPSLIDFGETREAVFLFNFIGRCVSF
jgi:hypothetical protein